MNAKRVVRGLFGVLEAEASGQEWSLEGPSENYIPGLGWGASEDVRRWAQLMRERESLVFVMPEKAKKGIGQPKKVQAMTNDVLRAIVLYQTACRIRAAVEAGVDKKLEMPLFKLISLATEIFPTHGLFEKPKADNKMHASVKRGRKICDIDEYWRGKPFLEIVESLFKLD